MSRNDKLFLRKLLEKEIVRLNEAAEASDEVDSALANLEQKNSVKAVQQVVSTLLKAIKKFEESTKDDHFSLRQHIDTELKGIKSKLLQIVKDDNFAAGFIKQEVTPRKQPKKVVFKPVGKTL